MPKNRIAKIFHQQFWKNPLMWWSFALLIWFIGIGGRDLYALPALIGLVFFLIQPFDIDHLFQKFDLFLKNRKVVLYLFGSFSLLLLLTVIAKTYSFCMEYF